jgi:hypothetical protein
MEKEGGEQSRAKGEEKVGWKGEGEDGGGRKGKEEFSKDEQ